MYHYKNTFKHLTQNLNSAVCFLGHIEVTFIGRGTPLSLKWVQCCVGVASNHNMTGCIKSEITLTDRKLVCISDRFLVSCVVLAVRYSSGVASLK